MARFFAVALVPLAVRAADYSCPAGQGLALKLWATCSGTADSSCSTSSCCTESVGTCLYWTNNGNTCPSSKCLKADLSITGNAEADCCITKPTCGASFSCSDGMKAKASTTTCAQHTCIASDCCEVDTTKCLSHSCPSGTSSNPSAYGTDKGSTPDTTCCTDNPVCSSVTCADGYKRSTKAETEKCTSSTCSTYSDCCTIDSTKCNAHMCSSGYTHKSNPGTITGSTDALCCDQLPTGACSTEFDGHCAPGMTLKSSQSSIVGSTSAACCEALASCSSYTCPTTHTHNSVSYTVGYVGKMDPYCSGTSDTTCSQQSCCETNMATCAGHTCPSSKVHVANLDTIGNTDALCCVDPATCSAFSGSCSAGYKAKAGTTTCSGAACTEGECCELDSTKCLHYASTTGCGTGKYIASSAYGTDKGSDAAATCCTDNPLCMSVTCSTGYKESTKARAEKCTSSTCSTTSDCCTFDSAQCHGHTCSTGFSLKSTAASITGSTDADCCDAHPTCSTVTCATGYKKDSSKAGTVKCASSTCSTMSDCCTRDTAVDMCDDFTGCPSYMSRKYGTAGATAAVCCDSHATCRDPNAGGGAPGSGGAAPGGVASSAIASTSASMMALLGVSAAFAM